MWGPHPAIEDFCSGNKLALLLLVTLQASLLPYGHCLVRDADSRIVRRGGQQRPLLPICNDHADPLEEHSSSDHRRMSIVAQPRCGGS